VSPRRSGLRLDAYIRVSRVAGRSGESFISPAVQRERIEAAAVAGGHTIVEWHEDLDEPGSRYDRPGFQRALERVDARETDGIIVASLDRFARSVTDAALALRRLEDAGAALISVRDSLDTSMPIGRFARTMMLALGELELDRIRENWSVAQARAVARGVHIASRTPTGYSRGEDGRLVPDPIAAPVVRELFLRRAAGAGWRELSNFMDSQQVVGPYANASWTPSTLRAIVANRVYLGEARGGQNVNEHAHEPLVSRAEWEAAQGERTGRSARNGDGLLLAGLVRWASCRYVAKSDRMRDRDGSRLGLYRCRGRHPSGRCPAGATVLARIIDPWVEQRFLEALGPDGPLAHASQATHDTELAARRLDDAEAELVAYRDANLVSVIGQQSFQAGLETRARAVDAARAELAVEQRRSELATMLPSTPGSLVEAWANLSLDERRTILRAAIDAVIVRPARGAGRQVPIDERALILWRGQAPTDLPRRGRRGPLAAFPWPSEHPDDVGVPGREDAEPRSLDRRNSRRRKGAHARPPAGGVSPR